MRIRAYKQASIIIACMNETCKFSKSSRKSKRCSVSENAKKNINSSENDGLTAAYAREI